MSDGRTLRERLIETVHSHGLEPQHVIERAEAYETWILAGKPETARPVLTAGKNADAEAGAKR